MPRAALSTDEIADFRRKVILAATGLFARQGYAAVTMRAIADELGTSAMAPYRYFENKAEIFALVRAQAARAFFAAQRAALVSDVPPFERLLRARKAYVGFALEQAELYRVIFETSPESEDTHPELLEAYREAADLMLQLGRVALEGGIYQGDPLTIGHLLWAQVHGLVSLHLAGMLKGGRSLEQLLTPTSSRVITSNQAAKPRTAAAKKRKR